MSVLERDDTSIYYEHRRCSNEDAPTVLLSHGYSATSRMWSGQVEAITASHHLITWDMRGHGKSDSPADPDRYSEEHTVNDMAALLDACNAEQAVIGGLSLGGYMTLAFNVAFPARCSALMLFDTGPGYKSDKAREGWNRMANARADQLEEKGLGALGTGSEVKIAQHTSAMGLTLAARGMLAQQDDRVIASLPGISLPTLVLVGADDDAFLTPTDYMAAKIPGAQKVVLDNAGHAANIDQPNAFNQAVRAFLDNL